MKAFSFLALIFLISCSSDYEGFISEEISEPEETYFDRIFFDSSSTFNGYKLGDSLLETVITSDSLSNSVFYTSFINVSEDKINNIELEIHVEYKEEANELVSFIVAKYNHLFNYSKTDATLLLGAT